MIDIAHSDFDIDFGLNAFDLDISTKKNAASIRQSVINIVLTSPGEKPFDPDFGVGIYDYLFENSNNLSNAILQSDIQEGLLLERRIGNVRVAVDDTLMDTNQLGIQITYDFTSSDGQIVSDSISLSVTKVR